MNGPLIQILTGTLGTLGYALVFHVRVKLLPAATMGGLVSWAVYLLIYFPTHNLFLASLIAAMAVYAWSEIMARLMKAPVTVFLLPGVIPLLPGSFLYYTTLALLNEDAVQFKILGLNTIASTMGIACGVVIASIVASYLIQSLEQIRKRRSGH